MCSLASFFTLRYYASAVNFCQRLSCLHFSTIILGCQLPCTFFRIEPFYAGNCAFLYNGAFYCVDFRILTVYPRSVRFSVSSSASTFNKISQAFPPSSSTSKRMEVTDGL